MMIARRVAAVLIVMIAVPVVMMTAQAVVAASIVMTVVLGAMMIAHLAALAVMTTDHLVVAVSIVMTAVHAEMMTDHLVALAAMMIARRVAAASIVMIVRRVAAVLIVMIVVRVVTSIARTPALPRNVSQMKSVAAQVDVAQPERCPFRHNAHAKTGLTKVQLDQRVALRVFVQKQRVVRKRADARKFAHLIRWWKSLSVPLVHAPLFVH
jgi:hypothetical protein